MNTGDDAHTMHDYLESLWANGDTGDDYASHEVLSEGAARYGRRLLVWDDLGFSDVVTYGSLAEAERAMEGLHEEYDAPDDYCGACGLTGGCAGCPECDLWSTGDDEHGVLHYGSLVTTGDGLALRVRATTAERVRVVAVGDDHEREVGRDEVRPLSDDERPCSCGSLTCAWSDA